MGWRVRTEVGGLELQLEGRPGVTERARRVVLLLLTSICNLSSTPNPIPRLNAGSKPKAEPSNLTNLHPKPSLSPCRLEALYLCIPKP